MIFMFIGVTFVHLDEKGEISDEIKGVVNSQSIRLITENHKAPNTCMIVFNDDMPSGLIKGTYEQYAKVLFGFNRKM